MKEGQGSGVNDEEIEALGGAGCLRADAGRGLHERWRGVPQNGISKSTFYAWRKKYAGLMPSEMRRMRQLEEENAKLKRLVVDLSLDKAMLQDVVSRKL